jgi:predicted SnoaL-like aldol condensation-catalyzing enzyme
MKKIFLFLMFVFFLSTGDVMANNLERAKEFFEQLDKDHMDLVEQFYDPSAVLQDPVHRLQGASSIRRYYEGLYKDVKSIRFEFTKAMESGDVVTLEWRMYLRAPGLEGGKEFTVDGASIITFGGNEGHAIVHRDYFDMGEFIYERIPVLKSVIGMIKGRLAK